jgi:hypothetical protein
VVTTLLGEEVLAKTRNVRMTQLAEDPGLAKRPATSLSIPRTPGQLFERNQLTCAGVERAPGGGRRALAQNLKELVDTAKERVGPADCARPRGGRLATGGTGEGGVRHAGSSTL